MNTHSGGEITLKLNSKAEIAGDLFTDKKDSITADRVQTDRTFVERLILLKERTQMLEKHVFANRPKLTEEQFVFIERAGELHYRCQIINENSSKDPVSIEYNLKCEQCGKASGEPLPYCLDIEQTFFFGPGIILFFYYAKRIILLVTISILIFGVYALVTNIVGGNNPHSCSQKPGGIPFLCNWIKKTALSNKNPAEYLLIIQTWLAVPMTLFWAVAIRFIRDIGRIKSKEINDKLDSSSDYCIWLEGLPEGQYNETDLIVFLSKLWRARKDTIHRKLVLKSVQIVYQAQQIRQITAEIKTLGIEMCGMFKQTQIEALQDGEDGQIVRDSGSVKEDGRKVKLEIPNTDKKYVITEDNLEAYKECKKRLVEKYEELKNFREKFLKDRDFRKALASETALVEFESSEQQQEFLEKYGKYNESQFKKFKNRLESACQKEEQSLTFKGQNITIFRAPEPSDINWANAELKESNLRVLAVWAINIVLIGVTFGALMLYRYIASVSPLLGRATFIKIIILNLFNRIIWNILNSVIEIEKNKTKTESIVSVMNKSYIAQSFNIIVLPMVMNLSFADNLEGVDGLSGAVHDYQLTAFIFMILFNLINVPHRLTQLLVLIPCVRRLLISYLCRVTNELNSVQQIKEILNSLYSPPKVPVAGLYVYITSTVNQAFFFCHIQPILLVYLLFNLIIFYLVNRHLLLRMCCTPDMLDFFVFQAVIVYAMNVPLLYAIGSTVMIYLSDSTHSLIHAIPSILCFIIWFMSSQNPFGVFQRLVKCLEECIWGQQFQDLKSETEENGQVSMNSMKEADSDSDDEKTNKRRENYYANSPVSELFNFENKLSELQGPYHNKFRNFCQKFNFNQRVRRRPPPKKMNITLQNI